MSADQVTELWRVETHATDAGPGKSYISSPILDVPPGTEVVVLRADDPRLAAPVCHNGHPFEPGVDTDDPEHPSDEWCNVCGETQPPWTYVVAGRLALDGPDGLFARALHHCLLTPNDLVSELVAALRSAVSVPQVAREQVRAAIWPWTSPGYISEATDAVMALLSGGRGSAGDDGAADPMPSDASYWFEQAQRARRECADWKRWCEAAEGQIPAEPTGAPAPQYLPARLVCRACGVNYEAPHGPCDECGGDLEPVGAPAEDSPVDTERDKPGADSASAQVTGVAHEDMLADGDQP